MSWFRFKFSKKGRKAGGKTPSPLFSRVSSSKERDVKETISPMKREPLEDTGLQSEDSDWWLVDPNVTQTQRSWPEWGTASNSDLLQPYSWSVPASPQINRRYASSLTSSSCSLCSLPRTGGSCICKQRESFGMGRAGTPVLARSSAAMCDSPSPTREMRIAEFPESPTASLRRVSSTSSAARLRDKKMRSSVGTSDLTRPRLSFADSLGGDYEDSECREHFTLDSIMVTHKETKDSQQQLNQYIVGEMIGKGSYGMVLKCTNVLDKKDYALKVISKHHLRKASAGRKLGGMGGATLQAVKHEIAILKKVNHRNVVKLLEVIDGENEDEMYLVFELVEQGHVIEVNAGQNIPEERAWDYFIDILLGVEYLHYLNIVHRDIKPSNLLLDSEDRVMIADFGVSQMFEESQPAMLSRTAGSPAFMAPETLKYESSSTLVYGAKPADIWSVGVTLYCMVFGVCPFWPSHSNDIIDLQERILHQELSFPDEPEISQELRDLLIRLLEKDPSRRISIPEIRDHPWVLSRIGQYCQRLDEDNVADTTVSEEEITAAYGQGQKSCISYSASQQLLRGHVTDLVKEDSGLGSSREESPSRKMGFSPVSLKNSVNDENIDSAFESSEASVSSFNMKSFSYSLDGVSNGNRLTSTQKFPLNSFNFD